MPGPRVLGADWALDLEPLTSVPLGPAVLPVSRDVVHTHASPRSAIGFLIHAAGLPSETVGARRNITLPGVAVSVGEQIEALRRVAGESAVGVPVQHPVPARQPDLPARGAPDGTGR